MSHLYQQYRALELDGSWIGLEAGNATPWFCTPIGAEIIGWDGAIHYCFVPGFAETSTRKITAGIWSIRLRAALQIF